METPPSPMSTSASLASAARAGFHAGVRASRAKHGDGAPAVLICDHFGPRLEEVLVDLTAGRAEALAGKLELPPLLLFFEISKDLRDALAMQVLAEVMVDLDQLYQAEVHADPIVVAERRRHARLAN